MRYSQTGHRRSVFQDRLPVCKTCCGTSELDKLSMQLCMVQPGRCHDHALQCLCCMQQPACDKFMCVYRTACVNAQVTAELSLHRSFQDAS